ncbi:DUF6199 family natural product biosynthesis protein [Streptomyces ambofaciens]
MSPNAVVQAATDSDGSSPVFVLVLCFFLVMGVIQVVRPQLLWKANARLQRGWVKNHEATEPTSKGYANEPGGRSNLPGTRHMDADPAALAHTRPPL